MFAYNLKNSVTKERVDNTFYFSFHGRPISKVEVMGIVIGVLRKETKVTLYLDDGTDILRCQKYNDFGEENCKDVVTGQ